MSTPFAQVIDLTIDGGDEREVAHGYPTTCRLVGAYFAPATTLAEHADNHQTLTLKKGAGGTAVGYITSDTGDTYSAAYTKGTVRTIVITGSGTNIEFAATSNLEIVVAEAGTTAALDGQLTLLWQPIR
jgi:hypothetical protein